MEISKQLYYVDRNHSKHIGFRYIYQADTALNLTGWFSADISYGFVKSLLAKPYRYSLLVTDTDLLAHDDYMERLDPTENEIVFICRQHKSKRFRFSSLPFNGESTNGASAKRLKRAAEKLKQAGFSVRYFVNEDACNRYIARQTPESIARRLKKHRPVATPLRVVGGSNA